MTDSNDRTCVECGARPPETNTEYTLISSAHGWRLVKVTGVGGRSTLEWRCPNCWKKFKDRQGKP